MRKENHNRCRWLEKNIAEQMAKEIDSQAFQIGQLNKTISALREDVNDEAVKAAIAQGALATLGCPYETKTPEFEMWVIYTAYKLGQLVRK